MDLLDYGNSVPSYLKDTLPDSFKPKRMLRELSKDDLISIRKKADKIVDDVISDVVQENKELIKQAENPECLEELK